MEEPMADLNFNANEVDPASIFDPLPGGRYMCIVVESAMKPTKAGPGKYLELKFQVVDGEHKGRYLWCRLCLDHANAQAVQIARGQLSSLCRACGIMQPHDSVELHNIPIQVRVRLRKNKETQELENEVTGFLKRFSDTQSPQQATTNAPPWRRP
jgi:hypothetical protein